MAKILGNGQWASDLLKALGEDPSRTRKITLVCEVGNPVIVTIEKFVFDTATEPFLEVIRKAAWIKEENGEKD